MPKERLGGRMTEGRREEIVRKAAALFIEKGYANVTRALAARRACSTPSSGNLAWT